MKKKSLKKKIILFSQEHVRVMDEIKLIEISLYGND